MHSRKRFPSPVARTKAPSWLQTCFPSIWRRCSMGSLVLTSAIGWTADYLISCSCEPKLEQRKASTRGSTTQTTRSLFSHLLPRSSVVLLLSPDSTIDSGKEINRDETIKGHQKLLLVLGTQPNLQNSWSLPPNRTQDVPRCCHLRLALRLQDLDTVSKGPEKFWRIPTSETPADRQHQTVGATNQQQSLRNAEHWRFIPQAYTRIVRICYPNGLFKTPVDHTLQRACQRHRGALRRIFKDRPMSSHLQAWIRHKTWQTAAPDRSSWRNPMDFSCCTVKNV